MSYHDVLFPIGIAYGARGGPEFSTTVLELASGYEKRNINWSKVRARYNVTQGVKTPDQMNELLNFFYARYGRAYSFPFLDHKDQTITNQVIGIGDGETTEFQIFKRYTSGDHDYNRLITKIQPNTIGDVMVGGVPNEDYTLNLLTGRITFDDAPENEDPIIITKAKFYVHCRFDTDYMDIELENWEAETWSDINIVEIKEDVEF